MPVPQADLTGTDGGNSLVLPSPQKADGFTLPNRMKREG